MLANLTAIADDLGQGAARVCDLFAEAKAVAPAICSSVAVRSTLEACVTRLQ
ncbi:MAG: hypothetical protein WKF94_08590 [Solirubrobacteraceae bacterium]